MITMPDLQTALLDLLYEVQGTEVKLIIGGGYGIYLKNDHVRRMGMRTLLREWPEQRSTNDLDLFLRPELLINPAKLKPLADAIDREKHQGRFIYLSDHPEICSRQMQTRASRQAVVGFPSDSESVEILVHLIKYPDIGMEQLAAKVSKPGKQVAAAMIRRFLRFHDLLKRGIGAHKTIIF
jgi:hypothetical protein